MNNYKCVPINIEETSKMSHLEYAYECINTGRIDLARKRLEHYEKCIKDEDLMDDNAYKAYHVITEYFKYRGKIIDQIEKTGELMDNGKHKLDFQYNIYDVTSIIDVIKTSEPRSEDYPGYDKCDVNIHKLEITIHEDIYKETNK